MHQLLKLLYLIASAWYHCIHFSSVDWYVAMNKYGVFQFSYYSFVQLIIEAVNKCFFLLRRQYTALLTRQAIVQQ